MCICLNCCQNNSVQITISLCYSPDPAPLNCFVENATEFEQFLQSNLSLSDPVVKGIMSSTIDRTQVSTNYITNCRGGGEGIQNEGEGTNLVFFYIYWLPCLLVWSMESGDFNGGDFFLNFYIIEQTNLLVMSVTWLATSLVWGKLMKWLLFSSWLVYHSVNDVRDEVTQCVHAPGGWGSSAFSYGLLPKQDVW